MDEYTQKNELPSVEEYCEMRRIACLSDRSPKAARIALPNSLFATCIRQNNVLAAMGRVVGDGGCNFEIVDVAVHPDHQQQGLGYRIMQAIMEYIEDNAPESAYICLIADHHSPALYKKFGFEFTAPVSVGMAYKKKKTDQA